MDDQQTPHARKFARFVVDIEVEITDPTATAAFNMNWTDGPDGPAMLPTDGVHAEVQQAITSIVGQSLGVLGHKAGFKCIGLTEYERPIDETGVYPEMPVIRMPGRREDGSTIH